MPKTEFSWQGSLVLWASIKPNSLFRFRQLIQKSKSERELQLFLERNPIVLLANMGGGRGRYVIPQKKLGTEYITDFMIGDQDKAGFTWTAVEIESPTAPLLTKSGDISRQLRHAIRQIKDWRRWVEDNKDYASRPKKFHGLELADITPAIPGIIIIGRDRNISQVGQRSIDQEAHDNRIEIHTYDWLLRRAEEQVKSERASPLPSDNVNSVLKKLGKTRQLAKILEMKQQMSQDACENNIEMLSNMSSDLAQGMVDAYWLTALSINQVLRRPERNLIEWFERFFYDRSKNAMKGVPIQIGLAMDQLANGLNAAHSITFAAVQNARMQNVISNLPNHITPKQFTDRFSQAIREDIQKLHELQAKQLDALIADSIKRVRSSSRMRSKKFNIPL